MKKLFLILATLLIVCPQSYAKQTHKIAFFVKKAHCEKKATPAVSNPFEEVKRTFYTHLKYANSYDIKGLSSLYSPSYLNADGINKDIYFDLVKKTWDSYPDIKYKMNITNISVSENTAVVQVNERAEATTDSKSSMIKEKGLLESISDSIYYLEKSNNEWLITSDHIVFEKTFLLYGSAKDSVINLSAPCQIPANTPYTASLKIIPPKDSFIIASIGQENITYPQTTAPEVFRKLPDDGVLERMFKSNDKNINEYAVASFGITKAEINPNTEIRIYVTGLGFAMSRINVIPKNDFVKVADNEKAN